MTNHQPLTRFPITHCRLTQRLMTQCRRFWMQTAVLAALVTLGSSGVPATAGLLITEINSNGTGGDFFEIYNSSATAVSLGGWKWVDNASGANGGPSFNGARAFAFDAFTLQPGGVALVVTDASGGTEGNSAFNTSWGLTGTQYLTFNTGTITGNGLGQNDLIALFNPDGNFVTGLNYSTAAVNIVQGDTTTVSLAPFNRVSPPGGISAGGHAGAAGGGLATVSLIWDPTSPASAPLYTAASSVGLYGSFENPNSSLTIGSPGIVPEPSTVAMAALGGALAVAGAARRRLMRKPSENAASEEGEQVDG